MFAATKALKELFKTIIQLKYLINCLKTDLHTIPYFEYYLMKDKVSNQFLFCI